MPAFSSHSKRRDGRTTQSSILRWSRAALVGVAILVAFGSDRVSHAHGEAEWIMAVEPRCCGPNDCAQVGEGGVRRVMGGFVVLETGEVISERDTLWSIDEHYWRCHYTSGVRTGQTRCLFVPALGF